MKTLAEYKKEQIESRRVSTTEHSLTPIVEPSMDEILASIRKVIVKDPGCLYELRKARRDANNNTEENELDNKQEKDMVNSPAHYKFNEHGIECIDAIRATLTDDELRGYLKGNVFKYLWRERYKHNSVEDVKKASWYLNRLIELLEKGNKNG